MKFKVEDEWDEIKYNVSTKEFSGIFILEDIGFKPCFNPF